MAYKGKRSYLVGPWHNCSRCDDRTHISDMVWQRGLLLDEKCVDKDEHGLPLQGNREMAITGALESAYSTANQEMMPDPKLTSSDEIQSSMDEDIIY